MEKPNGKGDGNDIGDCSDDDLFKGSDDAVNVVKSSKHASNIHSFLPYQMIYICTMVSVIGIVVTVVLFGVISNDEKKTVFQLSKVVSRMSNQLESLSSKIYSHNSRPDGPQTCETINTSYLYYALQGENRRLKDELQKTKSIKVIEVGRKIPEGQSNIGIHLPVDLNKLTTICFVKDSITCADTDNKPNQQDGRKEQYRSSCNLVSSANNIYGWVVANRSLSLGSSDHFNLIMKFKLFYPEIPDNGKIFFEFGLTTCPDDLEFNHRVIIVRGQRCEKEPGMCLYVKDNVLTKLEGHVFEKMSDYIQGLLTVELHKSYFVLMSNQKNIYISNMLNLSSYVKLWPVFTFYNTHLINISQTIFSENKIGFNRTTVDPHLFVSEENNTISNYKLWSERTSFTEWDVRNMYIKTAFFVTFMILSYLLMLNEKP